MPGEPAVQYDGVTGRFDAATGELEARLGGRTYAVTVVRDGESLHLIGHDGSLQRVSFVQPEFAHTGSTHSAGEVVAPMTGKIERVFVSVGERVEKDQPLVIMEAMKMEVRRAVPRHGAAHCAPDPSCGAVIGGSIRYARRAPARWSR